MPNPSKQVIIDAIIAELEKGFQRGEILVKIGKKWGISKSAFDRHLKIAKEQLSIKRGAIEKAKLELDTKLELEAREKAIMSVFERQEYLTKLIKGEAKVKKPFVIQGKIMEYQAEPDHEARVKALSELNKMTGAYPVAGDEGAQQVTEIEVVISKR